MSNEGKETEMGITNESFVTTIFYAVAMSCIASGLSGIVATGNDARMMASGVAWMLFCSLYAFGDMLMMNRKDKDDRPVSGLEDKGGKGIQLLCNLSAWVMFAMHGVFLGSKSVSVLVVSSLVGVTFASVSVIGTVKLSTKAKSWLCAENILFGIGVLFVECDQLSLMVKDFCRNYWFLMEVVAFVVVLFIDHKIVLSQIEQH